TARLVEATQPHPMLGLGVPSARDDTEVDLAPGDTVLLYTDGLVERRGESINLGIERLRAVLLEPAVAGLTVEELADHVVTRLAPDWNEDDIALVVVRLVDA
ncbi:MAG: histidine kinase, partial [Nocardioides sp.]|nr:histidine kinase [Nocardioides sp.]